MRRPDGDKGGKKNLAELSAKVQAALSLLESEEADAIIADGGGPDEVYQALIQGANAIMSMHWSAMKGQGVRQSADALRMAAQAQMIVLDLVHKAYAAGVRRGNITRVITGEDGDDG